MKADSFTAPTSPPNLKPMTNPRDLIKRLADDLEGITEELVIPEYAHTEKERTDASLALVAEARAYLAQPEPEQLPQGYVDPEHKDQERELLELFYRAYQSESGTVDEMHLRGIKAVLANAPIAQSEPEQLPQGYVDPEHKDQERELLELFYRACRSESGTVDEDHLRGIKAVLANAPIAQPEPEATITEPRGCPTPGACSCPTAPYVPPELIRALELAEAALADIGDAEREPGDDLAWAEARAAQDLPRIRTVLARWGRSPQ
jgi:hypothetical protein